MASSASSSSVLLLVAAAAAAAVVFNPAPAGASSTSPRALFANASVVPTPFGRWERPECVISVPSGTLVDLDRPALMRGDGSRVRRGEGPDGKPVELVWPAHCGGADDGDAAAAAAPQLVKEHNLKQWRVATQYNVQGGVSVFNGRWVVPDTPASDDGQIVYTFTGIQPSPGTAPLVIAQPVLEYGNGQWTLASWFCCTSGHSNPIPTAPGHVVNGTMYYHNGAWVVITTDETTKQSTTLRVQTSETLSDAYVTLESYRIASCSDYPTKPFAYTDLMIKNNAGTKVTPQWGKDRIDPACDETITIHSPTAVSIDFQQQ